LVFAEKVPPGKSRVKKQAQYLAQKLHVVERIATTMDVAGASIILG
jgi:hypothetical protein